MSKKVEINVHAQPSVNYDKFQWTYKPASNDDGTPSKGELLLAALKTQFGYKPVTRNGKEQAGRKTFTKEWVEYAQRNLNIDFIIESYPTIPSLRVGDTIPNDNQVEEVADFSFLS